MDNNELYHHGILGMKWGIRRYQNKDGTLTAAGKARKSSTEKSNKEASPSTQKKALTDMSDEEIRAMISRLKLEQEYKDLFKTTSGKKEVSAGRKLINEILTDSIKNIGKQTVSYVMGSVVNQVAVKVFKSTDPAIINPKKGQSDKK